MPTYEYECTKCGYNFEVFQAMSDEPLKTCTKCGKKVRRLILGGAGVIFKGSGFYVTDKAGGKTSGTEPKKAESSVTAQSAPSKEGACEGSASATAGDAKKPPAGSGAGGGVGGGAKSAAQTDTQG